MTHLAHSFEFFQRRKVASMHLETSIHEAAQALCGQNVGCLLVTDSQEHVVGILTDRDIVCSAVAKARGMELAISEIMTPRPIMAEEKDDLNRIVSLMEDNGIRRIPIVKKTGPDQNIILGILTLDDLVSEQLIGQDALARIVKSQLQGARKGPEARATTREERVAAKIRPYPEHSLSHFYNVIAGRILVNPDQALPVIHYLLGSLIRRLHYTGAAHLTARLPSELREELLDMPAGPDRNITVASLLSGLISRFDLDEPKARSIIFNFFAALEELLPEDAILAMKTQLPEEFRALLVGAIRPGRDKGHVA